MRIALDATYSLDKALSGVGVYSRELLHGLAQAFPATQFDWFYRSRRYWKSRRLPSPPNVTRRLLSDGWGDRGAPLFHGLNQRLPRRRFSKQIATFHDLFVLSGDYSTREFRERFARQAREAAAGADLIIAVSRFTASQVEDLLGVPASRIRVAHHGVTPRAIPRLPREKMVLCVGAIQRRKNQATLVRAFRALPSDWTLVLAGSQGYDASAALREVANSACVDRIVITGYIGDGELAELYARARLFAFPSLDEGFGMPVLEAMAAGVPVVAGNRSALPEVCGESAILVDPENEEQLAAAMNRIVSDEGTAERLIDAGVRWANGFPWSAAVEKTAAIYRELAPRELAPKAV
ncbi:MAG TPA: glycosyltransferase family 1 protein [Bryobacteraceae bacterium]|nr:glycosyltransferase family 1 protein [Bryobacteraceae bacterium]